MRQDLIDTIKKLSIEDTKTLGQKANKLTSELGELMDVILPMENALGARNKIKHRGQLLDEVADIMLVAMSIAYSNGFNEEDLDEMLLIKSLRWAEKQREQSEVDGAIPHEIHVTVDAGEDSIESFRDACKSIGIKPIVLDLHTVENTKLTDIMTSQVVFGSTTEAFTAMEMTVAQLIGQGYRVIRQKIEVAPWHPAAPATFNDEEDEQPKDQYFESHIEIVADETSLPFIKDVVELYGARLSNSVSKRNAVNGNVTIMATIRRNTTGRDVFEQTVKTMFEHLNSYSEIVSVRKPIIEYAIFDSLISRDAEWLA